MGIYPGWDSLDSVRNWHTIFEISGIAFLALLVGAEILAFQYGHRKDELTAIAESSAETKRKIDADAAEARRKTDVDALKKQLSEADKKVAELDRIRQPRHLTEAVKKTLLAQLSEAPKLKVIIKAGSAGGDERGLAEEIAAVLRNRPISWEVQIDNAMFVGSNVSGIWISAKGSEGGPVPNDVVTFTQAFADVEDFHEQIVADAAISNDNEVWLSIGRRK